MPLSLEDFSAIRVNWDPKVNNIREIANELNIGIDSIVFIDDSPTECLIMKEVHSQVMTIQLPGDPVGYADLLYSLSCFERGIITSEDSEKTEKYKQQQKRDEHKKQVTDITTYLSSLETKVTVYRPEKDQLIRVQQLVTKTNQFNLTTKRYDIGQIESLYYNQSYVLHVIDAMDKFGNLGTIGVYIVKINNADAYVDNFIISCRALGRGIETAAMNSMKKALIRNYPSVDIIKASYIPTKKNVPCKRFYDEQGFITISENNEGIIDYECKNIKNTLIEIPWITVEARS
jgi:FkbH-like protein